MTPGAMKRATKNFQTTWKYVIIYMNQTCIPVFYNESLQHRICNSKDNITMAIVCLKSPIVISLPLMSTLHMHLL